MIDHRHRVGPLRILAAALALALAGCAHRSPELATGTGTTIVTDAGESMLSLLETDPGIVVIDLGWWEAADELREALSEMDRGTEDVIAVLLTHAHRDHIAAWPALRTATFHLAEAEAPYLFGEARYGGWIPKAADWLKAPHRPARSDLRVATFSADTTLVFGRDTIRAFLVPGHTPGSAAFLARGVLYAGDALAHTPLAGYRHARPSFSDDTALAARSLRTLFDRVAPYDISVICSAHARCAEYTEAFRRDALRTAFGPAGLDAQGGAASAGGQPLRVPRIIFREIGRIVY